jgi:Rod binding domain-containing protein
MVKEVFMSDSFQILNTIKTRSEPNQNLAMDEIKNGRDDPELRQAAEDFEAAFISQMLKFSGLGEALTKGGGEDVSAFTDFYIENYAEKIVEKGGFGLADKFYDKLAAKQGDALERVLDVRS